MHKNISQIADLYDILDSIFPPCGATSCPYVGKRALFKVVGEEKLPFDQRPVDQRPDDL